MAFGHAAVMAFGHAAVIAFGHAAVMAFGHAAVMAFGHAAGSFHVPAPPAGAGRVPFVATDYRRGGRRLLPFAPTRL